MLEDLARGIRIYIQKYFGPAAVAKGSRSVKSVERSIRVFMMEMLITQESKSEIDVRK